VIVREPINPAATYSLADVAAWYGKALGYLRHIYAERDRVAPTQRRYSPRVYARYPPMVQPGGCGGYEISGADWIAHEERLRQRATAPRREQLNPTGAIARYV
jgi:hypothetical protein